MLGTFSRLDMDLQGEHFNVQIKPRQRMVVSMHPYRPIGKNEDGTGGGIRLRVLGERGESQFIDVVWGRSTEMEIVVFS